MSLNNPLGFMAAMVLAGAGTLYGLREWKEHRSLDQVLDQEALRGSAVKVVAPAIPGIPVDGLDDDVNYTLKDLTKDFKGVLKNIQQENDFYTNEVARLARLKGSALAGQIRGAGEVVARGVEYVEDNKRRNHNYNDRAIEKAAESAGQVVFDNHVFRTVDDYVAFMKARIKDNNALRMDLSQDYAQALRTGEIPSDLVSALHGYEQSNLESPSRVISDYNGRSGRRFVR